MKRLATILGFLLATTSFGQWPSDRDVYCGDYGLHGSITGRTLPNGGPVGWDDWRQMWERANATTNDEKMKVVVEYLVSGPMYPIGFSETNESVRFYDPHEWVATDVARFYVGAYYWGAPYVSPFPDLEHRVTATPIYEYDTGRSRKLDRIVFGASPLDASSLDMTTDSLEVRIHESDNRIRVWTSTAQRSTMQLDIYDIVTGEWSSWGAYAEGEALRSINVLPVDAADVHRLNVRHDCDTYVQAAADLVIADTFVADNWFEVVVLNQGGRTSIPTRLHWYSSFTPNIDTTVDSRTVHNLGLLSPSESHVSAYSIRSTSTLYVTACIEATAGESDTTNNCAEVVEILPE